MIIYLKFIRNNYIIATNIILFSEPLYDYDDDFSDIVPYGAAAAYAAADDTYYPSYPIQDPSFKPQCKTITGEKCIFPFIFNNRTYE